MKDLQQLENELVYLLDNIKRLKTLKKENEQVKWIYSQSNVMGELKHRIVSIKQTMTRVSKISTMNYLRQK